MVPTKLKKLLPEMSKELGIPEDHLKEMMRYYYKENKRLLENLEYLHIIIKGIGIMTIKGWELAKKIAWYEGRLKWVTYEHQIVEYTRELECYKKIQVAWDKQETHKKEIKLKRKEYYENKNKDESERETTTGVEE